MKQHHKLFDLTGRTIVVAGGAGQIGFAFCSILADAGASVILADIDTEMAKDKRVGLLRPWRKKSLSLPWMFQPGHLWLLFSVNWNQLTETFMDS